MARSWVLRSRSSNTDRIRNVAYRSYCDRVSVCRHTLSGFNKNNRFVAMPSAPNIRASVSSGSYGATMSCEMTSSAGRRPSIVARIKSYSDVLSA